MMLFCFVSLMPANILAFNSCDCNDSSDLALAWYAWWHCDHRYRHDHDDIMLILLLLLLHYCYYWCYCYCTTATTGVIATALLLLYWCYCYCTTATTGVINVIKLHCNVFHCFIVCEETGVILENVSIHLMKTWGMTLAVVTLRRTMGTNVSLGMTVMQTTVLLAFRRALTIIMVYL